MELVAKNCWRLLWDFIFNWFSLQIWNQFFRPIGSPQRHDLWQLAHLCRQLWRHSNYEGRHPYVSGLTSWAELSKMLQYRVEHLISRIFCSMFTACRICWWADTAAARLPKLVAITAKYCDWSIAPPWTGFLGRSNIEVLFHRIAEKMRPSIPVRQ